MRVNELSIITDFLLESSNNMTCADLSQKNENSNFSPESFNKACVVFFHRGNE